MRFGLLLVCVGCGRIAFDPVSDAAPLVDAAFSAPVRISELNTTMDEDDPSLTGDLLEMYFASARTGMGQIYATTRATATDSWSAPMLVTELNAGGDVNNPRITTDGLSIYFSAVRGGSQGFDLWHSTRPNRASPWTTPVVISELVSNVNDFEPWALQGELSLYFIRATSGTVPCVATRASKQDMFGPAVVIDSLDFPSGSVYDGGPWISANELVALMHSSRNNTTTDIYMGTRASTSDPFDPLVPLDPFNTAFHDEDPWLSPDGRLFVFSTNRDGNFELYMSTR